MIYKIVHRTAYKYKYPVSVGNHVACLKPRTLLRHPVGAVRVAHSASPGNDHRKNGLLRKHSLFLHGPGTAYGTGGGSAKQSDDGERSGCIARRLASVGICGSIAERRSSPEGLAACQFRFESPRIRLRPEFAAYALESFTRARPLREGLLDLTRRIHKDFRFDAGVTTVRTPTEEVFRKRRGVCQDFAHFQIACLRSLNLSARYVSGYLRTYPPPGQPRLVGADASHAWVSAYCPGTGWLDLDPTNNLVPSNGHVTLAWGRDYGDVSPLRGLILGGGVPLLQSLSIWSCSNPDGRQFESLLTFRMAADGPTAS